MAVSTWANGMRQISPGIYEDGAGVFHISVDELCAALGYPVTKNNCQAVIDAACAVFAQKLPDCKLRVITRNTAPDSRHGRN